MLPYSLRGMPCMNTPGTLIAIFRSPMGLPGPPGIIGGMLADHAEFGLIHGAFACLFTILKSPFGVGHAG